MYLLTHNLIFQVLMCMNLLKTTTKESNKFISSSFFFLVASIKAGTVNCLSQSTPIGCTVQSKMNYHIKFLFIFVCYLYNILSFTCSLHTLFLLRRVFSFVGFDSFPSNVLISFCKKWKKNLFSALKFCRIFFVRRTRMKKKNNKIKYA